MKKPNIYWVDLFCGGGGTTTGIHLVRENVKVVACVNHDANAIKTHKENHPDAIHFTEDIKDFKVVEKLKKIVDDLRIKEPDCVINLWASLECTNFSRAKGGLPRDADSRTLANHMEYYIEALDPDYFYVENVREFLSWGPLDSKGKPISRLNGKDYMKWEKSIESYGYHSEWKILNAADYASYQARERLFIIFPKLGLPVVWPEQTHSKKPDSRNLKKHKAVKDILDLEDEGSSIFTRKKPLVENTLKRIYAGLLKFVANDEFVYISNYKSGHPQSKNHSVEQPIGTVTTKPTQAIVSLQTYYGNGGIHSIECPSPTVTTKDRIAKVDVSFIDQQYTSSKPVSIEQPCNTLTTVPKFSLVKAKRFLYNPQYNDKGRSLDRPCFTLIARMDKAPPSIITITEGRVKVQINDTDSPTMILIKKFMEEHQIVDIKMRMLKICELKQIQGFPIDYKLVGTLTEQKKFIGNAVEVNMAKALIGANTDFLNNRERSKWIA